MSDRADHPFAMRHRCGVALLVALVTIVIGGTCALALWHTRAATMRALTLESAGLRAEAAADSVLHVAIAVIDSGGWRVAAPPPAVHTVLDVGAGAEHRRATVTRLGWGTLLLRGEVALDAGVPPLMARADHRVVIPLIAPLALPEAALTGAQVWSVDSAAVVELAPPLPAEVSCRAGVVPVVERQDSVVSSLDSSLVTPIDPDTVSGPLVGVFRLTRDRITRPLVITGMVESVTGLSVGADLQITGVLLVRESVVPAGGRLDVTGAVVTGDAGAGRSALGGGDRVRYDACAIRHAVARATRPGPARTWTTLRLF